MAKNQNRSKLIPPLLRPGNRLLVLFQEMLNKIFQPSMNPMYFLGAITFFLFWILLITGVYLLVFYDMNPATAYYSIEYMTVDQKYYGGIIRSLHRYASDGLVIVILLHILQVFFSDRFRHYRWLAWVTGIVILIPVWLEGVTGYFLIWDQKAQLIAEWLSTVFDALPIFSQPIARNFALNSSLSSTLFFVITFAHISLPSFLGAMIWGHCIRIVKPLINPPKQIAVAILLLLIALSLYNPALSLKKADMLTLPGIMEIDWFYLFPIPLQHITEITPGYLWVLVLLMSALFVALPWLIKDAKKEQKSTAKSLVVPIGMPDLNLSKCTGCNLCLDACPFEAINILPRSDGRKFPNEIEIISDRCAECGFCMAACPYEALAIGDFSESEFGKRIENIFAKGTTDPTPKIMVFICERSTDFSSFLTADMSRFKENSKISATIIPCIGFMNRHIIDSTLKAGAIGAVVVGCRSLDCHYREGRSRTHSGFTTDQADFPVEEMNLQNVKTMLVSRFAITKLINDLEEFMDFLEREKNGK